MVSVSAFGNKPTYKGLKPQKCITHQTNSLS